MALNRSASDNWNERKNFLIQSLFEDIPSVPTIWETNEGQSFSSFSKSPNENQPTAGQSSPLPDLIIEVIPSRPPCDESEEFYRTLERKLKQLYRRDFLGINDCLSSVDGNTTELNAFNEIYTHFDSKNSILESRCSSQETQSEESDDESSRSSSARFKAVEDTEASDIEDENNNNLQDTTNETTNITNFQESSAKMEQENSDSTNNNVCDEDKTTEALMNIGNDNVEDEFDDEVYDISLENELSFELYRNFKLSPIEEESTLEENSNIKAQEHLEELAVNKEASFSCNSSKSNFSEPEVMRRCESRNSSISLLDQSNKRFSTNTWDFHDKSLVMEVGEVKDEIMAISKERYFAEDTPDINDINITSTPKSSRKSSIFRKSNRGRHRINLHPYLSSSSNFTSENGFSFSTHSVKSQCLQTSFSDHEDANIWRNFFFGSPKIFKLCTCLNHTCI